MSEAPVDIAQVLLLFQEKNSSDYGLALWAALHEVESLYNMDGLRVNVRRFYISPSIPTSGIFDTLARNVAKFFSHSEAKNALDVLRQDERLQTKLSDAETMNSNSKNYDQQKLIQRTRDSLLRDRLPEEAWSKIPLMIVTDQSITPPENWRYIIFDTWPSPAKNAVISAAPLDPKYWGDPDPNRVAVIKDRVRNAAMSVCGAFLGLRSCRNPRCFLFNKVDSVTNLDQMSRLGDEHRGEAEELVGLGFERIVSDPNLVQEATRALPQPGGGRR